MNPLQVLRDVINEYELSGEDILHRIKRKLVDDPLNFNQFKESMQKLDSTLSPLQIKSLFELLKNPETGTVEIPNLIENLTGEVCSVNFRKDMDKKISEFIAKNGNNAALRDNFEKHDIHHDGRISTE